MTERKEALENLLAKVEAGVGIYPKDFPKGFRRIPRAVAAYYGSLDGAKLLHDALLPEWVVNSLMIWGDMARIQILEAHKKEDGLWHGSNDAEAGGENKIAARAWLIAILKALISQETTQ